MAMRYFSLLILMFIGFLPVCSSANSLDGEVLDQGIIQYAQVLSDQVVANDAGLRSSQVNSPTITVSTDRIPLQKDLAFGMAWQISGFERDGLHEITFRVEHPKLSLPAGGTSRSLEERRKVLVVAGQYRNIDGYLLHKDFELVPGTWTLSIHYGKRKLLSKSFRVVDEA